MIRRIAKAALGNVPLFRLAVHTAKLLSGRAERELYLLPFLVDPARQAVDVGANTGIYTNALLRTGADVVSVEANPDCVRLLERLYGGRVTLVAKAVSDVPGTATLRLPATDRQSGLSTLEPTNQISGAATRGVEVPVARLDDLPLGDVGFIKIDVEGHELAVLRGAAATLARCLPVLLIEAEERHRPGAVPSVREYLAGFGYEGFAIWKGLLRPLASLDVAALQDLGKVDQRRLDLGGAPAGYVNNFIFFPFRQAAAQALADTPA